MRTEVTNTACWQYTQKNIFFTCDFCNRYYIDLLLLVNCLFFLVVFNSFFVFYCSKKHLLLVKKKPLFFLLYVTLRLTFPISTSLFLTDLSAPFSQKTHSDGFDKPFWYKILTTDLLSPFIKKFFNVAFFLFYCSKKTSAFKSLNQLIKRHV